jgi:hypothetical protein
MLLNDPSDEQVAVISSLQLNHVIVDSVAGSGKTTTILHIARSMPDTDILLLTYNKRLKLETRSKVKDLGLRNIEVHSYHSFAYRYYDKSCHTDNEIKMVVNSDMKPKIDIEFDCVILDEAQDITNLYFKLVHKIIRDNTNLLDKIKLCILGDAYQSIYDFNLADSRYITFADKLFVINAIGFDRKQLSTTFRLTTPMCDFLNNAVLNQDRLHAFNKTIKIKPRYIICDSFGGNYKIFREIKEYLRTYKVEDIFILAASVKSIKSPIRILANALSNDSVAVYVPNSDEEKLDEDIIKGKIVFSTFHQVKGLERKIVIVFGFDDSYFRYYSQNKSPMICPNEFYVALTRATERLCVIHHCTHGFLPFLNRATLTKTCTIVYDEYLSPSVTKVSNAFRTIGATDLIRHLPAEVIDVAMTHFKIIPITPKGKIIDIPVKTRQGSLFESVCEITGVAIPAYYEYIMSGSMSILDAMKSKRHLMPQLVDNVNGCMFDSTESDDKDENKINIDDINLAKIKPSELLIIANEYCSFRSGYIYKLNQIKTYDWLTKDDLSRCVKRLSKVITRNAIYEKLAQKEIMNIQLKGYFDCVDQDNLYEFKCVMELEKEHFLQLAIYHYLNLSHNDCKYYLLNILTNEMFQITSDAEELDKMIRYLIYNKYFNNNKTSDEAFLLNALKSINRQ